MKGNTKEIISAKALGQEENGKRATARIFDIPSQKSSSHTGLPKHRVFCACHTVCQDKHQKMSMQM